LKLVAVRIVRGGRGVSVIRSITAPLKRAIVEGRVPAARVSVIRSITAPLKQGLDVAPEPTTPLRLPRVLVARSTHPGYFFLKLCTAYEDRRAG